MIAISENLNSIGCLRITHGPSVIRLLVPKIKSEGHIRLPTFSIKTTSKLFKS